MSTFSKVILTILFLSMTMYADTINIKAKNSGQRYSAQSFSFTKKSNLANDGTHLEYEALFFKNLLVQDLIPKSFKAKELSKLVLKNALVIHLTNTTKRDYKSTLKKEDIPAEILQHFPKWEDFKILQKGAFIGSLDIKNNQDLEDVLNKIGIDLVPFKTTGSMKANPIHIIKKGNIPLRAKKEFKDNFSFTMNISEPKIKHLDKYFKFENVYLGVNSGLYDKEPWKSLPENLKTKHDSDSLNMFLQAGSTVTLFGQTQKMNSLIDFAKKGTKESQEKEITILSLTDEGLNLGKNIKIEGSAGYKIDIKEKKEESKTKDFTIELAGFGQINRYNKHLDFTADFTIDAMEKDSKKMIKLNYLQIDDDLKVSDILGNKLDKLNISNTIKNLELDKLRLQFNNDTSSLDGIEATTKLFNEEVDFYLFEYGDEKGINLAFNLENSFTLDKILPTKIKNSKNIKMPKTMFYISEKGINTNRKDIKNVILRDVYDKIYNDPKPAILNKNSKLKMNDIGFISKFDATKFDKVGRAATKLGAPNNTTISADLSGVFDSKSFALDFYLAADIQKSMIPKKLAKTISFPPNVEPRVHIGVMKDEFTVGLGAIVDLKGKGPGSVSGEIQVDMSDDGLGLNFTGSIDEWKHPFNASSITLKDFMLEFELDDEATIKPGFNAKVEYLGKTTDVGGSIRLEMGDAGIPTPVGISLKGEMEELNQETWVYVDNAIVIILILLAAGVSIGGLGLVFAGVCTGGTALIIAAAIALVGGTAVLAVFSNIIGPTLTLAAIVDVIGENIAHPQRIEKAFDDFKKLDVGDGAKQLADAVIFPVRKDFKAVEKEIGILEAKVLTMKNAYISFATPGDADITNQIPEGFSVSGEAYLFDTIPIGHQTHTKDISNTDNNTKNTTLTAVVNPTQEGNPAKDFKLGPLEFKENRLHTRPNPLGITSKVKIFGVEEDVVISLKDGLYFDSNSNLGDIGDVNLSFKYDRKIDDFIITADLTSSIEPIINEEIKKGIDEIIKNAHISSSMIKKDLDKVSQNITSTNKNLATLLQKETDFINKNPKVASLEKNVNKAISYAKTGVISHINHLCKHAKPYCHHVPYLGKKCTPDGRPACQKANHYLIKKANEDLKKLQESLTTAKQNVALPKSLTTKYAKEKENLKKLLTKKSQIQALTDNTQGAKKFLNNLQKQIDSKLADNSIVVKKALLVGQFSDIQKGASLILEVKYTLNGKDKIDYFGFKPNNKEYNAKALALLPVIVLDNMLKNSKIQKVPYLTNWFLALVDKELSNITKNIESELRTEEQKYANILISLQSVKANLVSSTLDFNNDHGKTLSKYTQTDMMPPSKTFRHRYLAIGHSSLCLGVSSNGIDVYQENCKDIQSERWEAKSLGNSYIQLKSKGLCLKAKNKDMQSGDPLILAQCNKQDDHEQWKIISSDGFYDKIVNKYSQKCLHFDIENANPKTAYATWTSCLGMDSQTFRDIKDAQRPTYHNVNDMVKAKSGSCLSTKKSFDKYFKKSKKGHLTTSKNIYDNMKRRGDDILISTKCKSDMEDKFNYIELVNGDIKLIHAQSGWCVTPQSKNSKNLVLKPCNKNKNMFWKNRRNGNNFELTNNYLKDKCITLETLPKDKTIGKAEIVYCKRQESQKIQFVK
ncbi:RICIN domain-containing protein [Sulfurospirillum arcachonense]|uniref:RICIN domain-containing protein n=1 Tax=Sulfurospirillum arcachonense TaxID=57666 RepID=UPI000469C086|nr:ricin-type beta-trefoil lectin domain protein [Sulfurospirillum arcachonense]